MNHLVIVLTLIKITCGLVGYDCNDNHLNVTTISLNSIGDCSIQPATTETQDIYIQLLQLSEFEFTSVRQCKVQITRIIYYCGMHSHTSAVHNGFAEYLHETTAQQCARMHQDAGKLSDGGSCQGTQYVDPYGSWEKVVVQATVRRRKLFRRKGRTHLLATTTTLTMQIWSIRRIVWGNRHKDPGEKDQRGTSATSLHTNNTGSNIRTD